MSRSGSTIAVQYAVVLELEEEETISIHFYCEECEHNESVEIQTPAARMFSCGCPEEIDDNGNAKE